MSDEVKNQLPPKTSPKDLPTFFKMWAMPNLSRALVATRAIEERLRVQPNFSWPMEPRATISWDIAPEERLRRAEGNKALTQFLRKPFNRVGLSCEVLNAHGGVWVLDCNRLLESSSHTTQPWNDHPSMPMDHAKPHKMSVGDSLVLLEMEPEERQRRTKGWKELETYLRPSLEQSGLSCKLHYAIGGTMVLECEPTDQMMPPRQPASTTNRFNTPLLRCTK